MFPQYPMPCLINALNNPLIMTIINYIITHSLFLNSVKGMKTL